MDTEKQATQFWTTLIIVAGIAVLAGTAFFRGDREIQLLLTGGIISMGSAAAVWLYKNGNGNGKDDTEALRGRALEHLENIADAVKAMRHEQSEKPTLPGLPGFSTNGDGHK